MNEQEIISKVKTLVIKTFQGNYQRAFDHYSAYLGNGKIGVGGLTQLLIDACVGAPLFRSAIAHAIIDKMDKDGDQKITWEEFNSALASKK
jgi:hypothetical protein